MLWFPVQVRAGPPSSRKIKTAQLLQQTRIRSGKRKISQFNFSHPLHRSAIQRLWFARPKLADEKFQQDAFFGIGVGNFFKQIADSNLDAQFLSNLADEALFKSFARLALATGKLPQPALMRVWVALRYQQRAAAKNQCGTDFNVAFRRSQRRIIHLT